MDNAKKVKSFQRGESLGGRVHIIRSKTGKTQAAFGESIGVKGNTVAMYESGDRAPSNAVLELICTVYGADRVWLETGAGEPFREKTEDEKLAEVFGGILAMGAETPRAKLIVKIAQASDEQISALLSLFGS